MHEGSPELQTEGEKQKLREEIKKLEDTFVLLDARADKDPQTLNEIQRQLREAAERLDELELPKAA